MRSLDVSAERLNRVLDILVRAGRALTVSRDIVDSLTRVADACVGGFADYCEISIVVDAAEREEMTVAAGLLPEQPTDARRTIVESLTDGHQTFGEIICQTHRVEGFDDDIRHIVHALALQLAIVVPGGAAMLREHRAAGSFHQALLPELLPAAPGVEFHAAFRPASDEADVGGDWYDAYALADGRIAISMGDVAGQGFDAAVIMGEVRQAMRAAAAAAAAPTEVLEYANGIVAMREPAVMVTAISAIYDPATSMLSYAVAGHPPPILALACGLVRRLPAGGLPLGCASAVGSSDWAFTVPPGGRAVFYTNGLIENQCDLVAGEKRLLDVVRDLTHEGREGRHPGADPAAMVQDRVFGATANRDDAAVMLLSRSAPVARYAFSAVPIVSPIARAIVEREIESLPISEERRFGVLVAVGEAIANAVEHAYLGSLPGLIHLEIERQPEELVVRIEDFGSWRLSTECEERGRGIELMHAFMDGVQIRSTRESTQIVLKAILAG